MDASFSLGRVTMALLIDTDEVPKLDRARFWAEESGGTYHPLQIAVGANDRFSGRMWGERLAQIRLFRITAGANTMSRTSRDIAIGDPECLHFEILVRGGLKGVQQDRSLSLRPGDMTVYDTSRTAVFRADVAFDLLVVQIPKSLLGKSVNTLSKHAAVRIPGETGLPRLVARFLLEISGGLAGGSISQDDAGLQGHVLDLVRRVYIDLGSSSHPTRPHSAAELLLYAQAQIESRLSYPELCPSDIARACFISTRYLHKVFADEGLSVGEFIRTERLARCRRDLLDPGFADQPISVIASRWGLPNAAHFSRVFRDEYGCSPRQFRVSGGAAAIRCNPRHDTPFHTAGPDGRADAWEHAHWQTTEARPE
jgi:AraC-like DNA-binding protein